MNKQDLNGVRTPEDVVRRYDFKEIPVLVETTKQISLQVKDKVDSDKVISAINLSPEGTTIDGDKINLTGKVIDLTANNIQIKSDHFKVDSDGNITCSNATINGNLSQTLEGDYYDAQVNIGIPNNYNGSVIEVYDFDKTTKDEQYRTTINPGNVATYDEGRLQAIFGYGGVLWLYDVANNTKKIELTGSNGNITCVSLTQTSEKEKKKDFEKLDKALEIVKDTDIYKYHFKEDEKTDKKHIGFVIGDNFKYRPEITDSENKGVDLYSMVSVLWKAVQEQQIEIEELKKKVEK